MAGIERIKRELPESLKPANPNGLVEVLKSTDVITLQGTTPPPRKWVVQDWVPWGQVTMLGGDGGVGKSLIAQQLMTACATGQHWLGLETTPCKAFGLFCEDEEDELERRQMAINEAATCDYGDLENMQWISYTGGDASMCEGRAYERIEPTHFFHKLTETVHRMGAQLVVLDSLHDVFAGNENDRVQARSFIRLLQDLAQGIDGAVVLTAHPSASGLSSGSGYSGSTAWNNAVRSRLYLYRQDDEDNAETRVLSRKKANYAIRGDEIRLEWQHGVLAPFYSETGAVRAMEARNAENVFLDILAQMGREGRAVSENSRSGNYAPKIFAQRPAEERQGFRFPDFRKAMESLFSRGKIHVVEYQDGSRKTHKKIEKVEQGEMPL